MAWNSSRRARPLFELSPFSRIAVAFTMSNCAGRLAFERSQSERMPVSFRRQVAAGAHLDKGLISTRVSRCRMPSRGRLRVASGPSRYGFRMARTGLWSAFICPLQAGRICSWCRRQLVSPAAGPVRAAGPCAGGYARSLKDCDPRRRREGSSGSASPPPRNRPKGRTISARNAPLGKRHGVH
jgi:hypothetical protein